jgi:RHH-type proline utilization regulon transcriptional repressor/proline dehydrogenase/delta 1-pyrroline-5-carboxylate dehydrogenase
VAVTVRVRLWYLPPLLSRISSAAIALSKHFLPDADKPQAGSGLMGRLGAHTVVAAALRAVQLMGRQFVLGQDMGQAMDHADAARRQQAGDCPPRQRA